MSPSRCVSGDSRRSPTAACLGRPGEALAPALWLLHGAFTPLTAVSENVQKHIEALDKLDSAGDDFSPERASLPWLNHSPVHGCGGALQWRISCYRYQRTAHCQVGVCCVNRCKDWSLSAISIDQSCSRPRATCLIPATLPSTLTMASFCIGWFLSRIAHCRSAALRKRRCGAWTRSFCRRTLTCCGCTGKPWAPSLPTSPARTPLSGLCAILREAVLKCFVLRDVQCDGRWWCAH